MMDQWSINLALNALPATVGEGHPFQSVIQMIDEGPQITFSFVSVFGMRWHVMEHLIDRLMPHPDPEQRDRRVRMAEIGLEKGSTFLHLLRAGKLGLSVGVDNYHMPEKPQAFNDELEAMYQNLTQIVAENEYPAMVVRKPSLEAFHDFPEQFFDIVFVDALHDFLNVKKDIVHWRSRVRHGGIIAGHDFSLWHPSVMFAVITEAPYCSGRELFFAGETVWFCVVDHSG